MGFRNDLILVHCVPVVRPCVTRASEPAFIREQPREHPRSKRPVQSDDQPPDQALWVRSGRRGRGFESRHPDQQERRFHWNRRFALEDTRGTRPRCLTPVMGGTRRAVTRTMNVRARPTRVGPLWSRPGEEQSPTGGKRGAGPLATPGSEYRRDRQSPRLCARRSLVPAPGRPRRCHR